jgi:hypothetical protein
MERQWFSLSEVNDVLEESDTPKPNRRETKILDGRVGYPALAVRKEDHDGCSESLINVSKRSRGKLDQNTSLSAYQFCSMTTLPARRASEKFVQPPARWASMASNSWSGVLVRSLVRIDVGVDLKRMTL